MLEISADATEHIGEDPVDSAEDHGWHPLARVEEEVAHIGHCLERELQGGEKTTDQVQEEDIHHGLTHLFVPGYGDYHDEVSDDADDGEKSEQHPEREEKFSGDHSL